MAITLPAGFNITNKEPVDARITVADQAARLAFSSANVYNGLVVFQRDTNELYVLNDTGSWNLNSGWQLVGSGGTVNTGSLLETGSVSLNTLTFTKGDGSTFALTVDTGSGGGSGVGFPFTGSALITGSLGVTGSISVSGSVINQLTSSYAMTASLADVATTSVTASNIVFDGDRKISNVSMPVGVFDVNYGGTDLKQFVENVFFVNSAPVVQDTASISIGEYESIGTNVFVVTAIDAEAQTLTFITQSSYTDNYFGINSSTGQVTVNTKTVASMNTVTTGSENKAPFPVRVTDTGGLFGERTYYIRVIPNTAPIWSLTSGGTELTPNYTGSLTEASSTGANKYQFWFRDTESDTITINTGSLNIDFTNYFSLNIQSNYVGLDQDSALDFDTVPSMSFVLTASDQHFESGDDPSAIKYLPVKIEVQDNAHPTIGVQSFSINEKSNNGATVGTITNVSDGEGNNVQIPTFTLVSAHLASAPGTNLTQSLVAGGQNSLQNPTADPFEVANQNTRVITRKSGVFLNSDVADTYTYRAFATDQYQPSPSASAIMTITVADHAASTVNGNTPWYVIESARSGEYATNDSDGIPENSGEYADLTSAQSQRYTIVSTSNFIEGTVATGSATDLRLAIDLSGSGTTSGATINVQVTSSQDDFDTTIQKQDHTISVVAMQPPVLSPSDQSSNLNTNGARPSNNLVLVSITDPQSYGINHSTWTFTPNAGQALEAVQNGGGDSYYVRPTANLAAGTYGYTASISNDRGFTAGELKDEFTIAQAGVGTLTGDTTSYIIESSTGSGAQIKEDSNGYTGNQADLDVNYGGTGYNGAAVTDFTSSNAFIAVTSTGLLSVTGDVSGSYAFGDPAITSNINWQDQYGNVGGPTAITVNIAENEAPTATFTNNTSNFNTDNAVLNAVMINITNITDSPSDEPYTLTLSGTDAASFTIDSPVTTPGGSSTVKAAGPLAAATYNFTVRIKDYYGSFTDYSRSITVDQSADYGDIYFYHTNWAVTPYYGASGWSGINTYNATTPFEVTSFRAEALPLGEVYRDGLATGSGNDSIFLFTSGNDYYMNEVGIISSSATYSSVESSFNNGGDFTVPAIDGLTTQRYFFFIPSGSSLTGIPYEGMVDSLNGAGSANKGVLYLNTDGGGWYPKTSVKINLIDFGSAQHGYQKWYVVGTNAGETAGSMKWRIVPENGTAPT